MVLAYGVFILGYIGLLACSVAAPIGVFVGGITRLKGMGGQGIGLALLAWMLSTVAFIVVGVQSLSGNAEDMKLFGLDFDDAVLDRVIPVAWFIALVIGILFNMLIKRQDRGSSAASGGRQERQRSSASDAELPAVEVREIKCWSCKHSIPVDAGNRGKKVKCPNCGTKQALPA